MICPHCKKPINKQVTPKDRKLIIMLRKEGFSLRDIEAKIGRKFSFSTISRVLNSAQAK